MSQFMNSLQNKLECPMCHFVFIVGFDPETVKNCPSCKQRFNLGQTIDHGAGCSICLNRFKGSSNVYYKDGCPAIMSDGRFVTYQNSANELTEAMRKLNGFKNSNEFRNFMQNNGTQFMELERNHIQQESTCNPKSGCSDGWLELAQRRSKYDILKKNTANLF